jgi:hypothetical protein
MITSWNYSINSLPEFRYGTISLREEPWWLALCGWFIDSVIVYGCDFLYWIKMPKWLAVTDDGGKYSWRDYYGDLGQIYNIHIFSPLFHWHYSHPKSKRFDVEVGYDRVKELFSERDAKFFAEHEGTEERK